MSIRELLDYGITIEGNVIIQYWENDEPNILFDDDFNDIDYRAVYMNKDIMYMFPCITASGSTICIEIEW